MRVQLIHGGPWDGWRVVELDDGRQKVVRDIDDELKRHIRATGALEDITPASPNHPRARPTKPRQTSLTLIDGGA